MVAHRQFERVETTVDALEDLGVGGFELAADGMRRVCNALDTVDDLFVQHAHLPTEIIEAAIDILSEFAKPTANLVKPMVDPVEPLTKVFQCLVDPSEAFL